MVAPQPSLSNQRRPSFVRRNIIGLGLVSLFTDVSTEMSYAVIPVFLTEVLHAGPVFIGAIEAIAESTASVLKTFSGYLSDRLGRRRLFILLGYSFSALAKPLLALAQVGWHVLVVRFADRFGKGIRTAPRDALIADSTAADAYGRAFGLHRALDTLGATLGPLAAFIILALTGQNYRLLFGLAFIPGAIAIAIIVFGIREIAPQAKQAFSFSLRGLHPQVRKFLFIMIVFTLGNSSDAFLILRAREVGVPAGMIPLLWLAFNLSYFLWSYPAGMISDRLGRKKAIVFGLIVFSACYAAMAWNTSAALVWLIFVCYGLYYGFTEGNIRAFLADLTPAQTRGTVFGIYHTVIGVALLPANLLMGYLWHRFGFHYALMCGSGLSLAAGFLLTFQRVRRR